MAAPTINQIAGAAEGAACDVALPTALSTCSSVDSFISPMISKGRAHMRPIINRIRNILRAKV